MGADVLPRTLRNRGNPSVVPVWGRWPDESPWRSGQSHSGGSPVRPVGNLGESLAVMPNEIDEGNGSDDEVIDIKPEGI